MNNENINNEKKKFTVFDDLRFERIR